MFIVVDHSSGKDFKCAVKGGFMTYSQANNWCRKNLPEGSVQFWGDRKKEFNKRYSVVKK